MVTHDRRRADNGTPDAAPPIVIQVFFQTARQAAESYAYEHERKTDYEKRRAFYYHDIDVRVRNAMLDCMVREMGLMDGHYFQLPGGYPIGPYADAVAAYKAGEYWSQS